MRDHNHKSDRRKVAAHKRFEFLVSNGKAYGSGRRYRQNNQAELAQLREKHGWTAA